MAYGLLKLKKYMMTPAIARKMRLFPKGQGQLPAYSFIAIQWQKLLKMQNLRSKALLPDSQVP